MRNFFILWGGQTVSLLGSGLTHFALGVWVYQKTGSVTAFALLSFAAMVPGTLVSPLAGALADRMDRRRALILGDGGAGAMTLVIALLLWTDHLEIWHLYGLLAISALSQSLQFPAFTAATTVLVPKRHFARASGLTQMGQALGQILAPLLAGALWATIGLAGVIFIDVGTFLFAVATLLVIRIPGHTAHPEAGPRPKGSLLREAGEGWQFLRQRPGLLSLLVLFATANLALGSIQVLITPLVLSFSTPEVLGRVLSVAGLGFLIGSLLVSIWGGPRRRVYGILGALILQGAILMIGGLAESAVLIGLAAFCFLLGSPLVMASSQAIWQSKVPVALQGRVFSLRRMVAMAALPLAFLAAGPLSDRLFEPLLAVDGPLAGSVGQWIGVGPGRGIAFYFMLLGAFLWLTAVAGWLYRPIRQVEEDLPDMVEDAEEGPG